MVDWPRLIRLERHANAWHCHLAMERSANVETAMTTMLLRQGDHAKVTPDGWLDIAGREADPDDP